MENDITNLVQSMITGGVRGALGELAIRGIDEARFIQMFVEAGEKVAGYEYYKTEENDLRALVFDKESMTTLAKMMRSIDDFSWMDALEKELDHMLEGLDESNRENCKRHFMKIIETSIMRNEPDKYGRSLLMDTHSEVLGIRGEVQNLTDGNADLVGRAAAKKSGRAPTYQTGAERELRSLYLSGSESDRIQILYTELEFEVSGCEVGTWNEARGAQG